MAPDGEREWVQAGPPVGVLGWARRAGARMNIDVALVRRLVARQFPEWAHLSVTPVYPGGWDNRTFRLGTVLSVRLPSAEGYAGQPAKEHRWLPQLQSSLPLPIPVPRALGIPAGGYPWNWTVCPWLEGADASVAEIESLEEFAVALAGFLRAFQSIDTMTGPPAGVHNFFRGGSLMTYDTETRDAIESLQGNIDVRTADGAHAVWESALAATWDGDPVWVHGDVSAPNLLVRNGKLASVLDFGCLAVGDPACDVAIAWTLFSGKSREAYRRELEVDGATWARGRGWALWKALITVAEAGDATSPTARRSLRIIDEILAEYRAEA